MLDRITGLEVFAKVAALGSLSAAARAMTMSPTRATKHVAALEDRLGVKLFHRSTRKIALTEAGRRYLDAIEPILEAMADADSAAIGSGQDLTNMPAPLKRAGPHVCFAKHH